MYQNIRYKVCCSLIAIWAALNISTLSYAQTITGTVYRDYNANGTKNNTAAFNEIGVGGVTVACTDSAGGTGSTTTVVNGSYTLTGCTGATRVEFSGFTTGDYSGPKGTDNQSSIQFINATRTNVNFGVTYPADYSQDNPQVITPKYVNRGRSNSYDYDGTENIISFPYLSGQDDTGNGVLTDPSTFPVKILDSSIGSIYGIAYAKNKKKIFMSAAFKYDTKLGPSGGPASLGHIFVTDNAPNINNSTDAQVTTTSIWVDLNSGSYFNGALGDNSIPNSNVNNIPSFNLKFGSALKIGLGDLDISDAEDMLFTINLATRQLLVIPIGAGDSPPSLAQIGVYNMPVSPCNEGLLRPFAVKYYRGKVYIGAVCTGESNPGTSAARRANMWAYVFTYTPGNASIDTTPVLDFSLNFQRGALGTGHQGFWYPWLDTWNEGIIRLSNAVVGTVDWASLPQPILGDIEFDRGDMVLAFMDRFGFQFGYAPPPPPSSSSAQLLMALTGGDVMRAGNNGNGTWSIENNGTVTGTISGITTTIGAANSEGPGIFDGVNAYNAPRGEYYFDENENTHREHVVGGLGQIPGATNFIIPVFRPKGGTAGSGGMMWFNHNDGTYDRAYVLIESATPSSVAKGDGFGDIEILSNPAPIEIGNRVWLDSDQDGIQDPNEMGVSGVQVSLIKSGTTIANAITDANGTYYFSNAIGTDSPSAKYGLTQLVPNMAYTLRFPTTATVAGTTYNLTTAAAGSNRLIDSNAPANGEVTVLATDIPVAGANNHSFDVGYSSTPCSINAPTVTPTCNDNGTPAITTDDTFTFTISATGTGVGASYKVDKISPAPTATVFASVNYGATSAASSSFPISGGNLSLTLTDNTTSTCTRTPVTVTAPPTCSNAVPGQPDLKLLKTASHSSVNSGQTLTYTLTLTNEGTASATGVQVRDVLPASVTYVSSTPSQGTYDNGTGIWNVGTVAVGASLTLTITVTVN